MHLDTRGEGSDVVAIHGLPQHPDDLEPVLGPLRASHRVTVVHLPGYGRSPAFERSPYDIDAVGAQLAQELSEAGVRRPVLLGMSGGSYRCFRLALRHPEVQARGMAHFGPLAGLAAHEREGMRQAAQAAQAGIDMTDVMLQRMFSRSHLAADEGGCREIVERMLGAASGAVMAAELNAFAEAEDLLPRLGEIAMPIYLRVGAMDQATPPSHASAVHEALPSSRLDVVEGAGHLIHHEDAGGTLAALQGFLRDLDAG